MGKGISPLLLFLCASVKDAEKILEGIDCEKTIISLLTQVDKFDLSKLETCSGKIKMIRVSFHKNYMDLGIKFCEEVKKKGTKEDGSK